MNNQELKDKINEQTTRKQRKLAAKEARLSDKIDKENLTESRVAISTDSDGARLTITPPKFRSYFTSFGMQSFWATFMACIPVIIIGMFLLYPFSKKIISTEVPALLLTFLFSFDVILIFFILLVALFRKEFHLVIMDDQYALLRGKGMRLKRSNDKDHIRYEIFKYYTKGWARIVIKDYHTCWGFEFVNYNDIEKIKSFFREHIR